MSVAWQTRPVPAAPVAERAEDDQREGLTVLLKRSRARCGKGATQEEVAEAAGITRQWYAMLETGRPVRVSAPVLARIADVLAMDAVERAALFRLAVPELRSVSQSERSSAMLEALGSLRGLSRRLCSASTVPEGLALVREHALAMLAPEAAVTCRMVGEGRWDDAASGEDDASGSRFHEAIRRLTGKGRVRDLHGPGTTAKPGELIMHSERNAPANVSFATTHIGSKRGLFAWLSLVYFGPHEFSELERTQLSALAELTSLALRDA